MAIDPFSKSKKESQNQLNRCEAGRIIVDIHYRSVELEQEKEGRVSYLTLHDKDQIEVQNGSDYETVTIPELLERIDHVTKCSIYAGCDARVHIHEKGSEVEREFNKLPDLNELSDVEAIHWYTGEVAKRSKSRDFEAPAKTQALLQWKRNMHARFKRNRDNDLER